VRDYFDKIKKVKFLFDIGNVRFYNECEEWEDVWAVECEINDLFSEQSRHYTIHIDDGTGDFLDVKEIEN
jgi:hypothetical protein